MSEQNRKENENQERKALELDELDSVAGGIDVAETVSKFLIPKWLKDIIASIFGGDKKNPPDQRA